MVEKINDCILQKKVMYKKTLLVLLLFPLFLTSQNINLPTDYLRNTLSGKNNLPKNVTGSPYINENFKESTIIIQDKEFQSKVRYNGLNDTFEIKKENGEIKILNRVPSLKVKTQDGTYAMFKYFDDDNNKSQRFFKVLAENDNIKFIKIEGVEYNKGREAKNSYSQETPPSLKPFEEYYFIKNNIPAKKVRMRKKHILKYLDDDKAEEYVKTNNLKLKQQEEVIKLILNYK